MDCPWTAEQRSALIGILRQETDTTAALLSISQLLQEQLVRFDTEAIEQQVRKQEALLNHLEQLEKQRCLLLAQALSRPIEQVSTMSLTALYAYLPHHERVIVDDIRTRLSTLTTELQRTNSINRMLALRGRNSIQATLNYVRQRNLHAVDAAL
ncbi:MAG: flagellar protein FlgN [Bacteroidota bacterium]|nr:flagellar protein FlgN [Candidatus Kapabacteria bacterium]MCS7302173.1 flagellar protein FlgN [Candidatus Kapabacteria bacterium]MCX7936398.1 flagellar protein FlgN [Chlorobiota bacterium]MDW8074322.1 flagellar protein FlgN [Bacteroidota bacterium]MDW8271202.1 flagellar protein FlgN [Bacteroidota bacterium]